MSWLRIRIFSRRSSGSFRRRSRALAGSGGGVLYRREQSFALEALAGELSGAADRLCSFADPLFGWLLVMTAELHLTEDALALHLLLQRFQGLIDIVVTNDDLHVS